MKRPAVIGAFNSRFRQECLNECWFLSVAEAQEKVESWRQDYNAARPRSSRGNLAPQEYAQRAAASGPPPGEGQEPLLPPRRPGLARAICFS